MAENETEKWFRGLTFMRGRKHAYQLAFGTPAGQNVLIDLARFCRASETCFDADPRKHAVLEGRREVWLRIQNHLGLSGEELMALATGQGFTPQEADNA